MLLAAVFVLFFLALCGSVVYGVFILYPLLLGLLSVGFVAWSRGYAIGTILRMGYTGAKQSLIVVEVFFHIGALTAAWRAAGTIGFLVHHGLQMLSPGAFLVGCFLLPLAFSVLLGTAIGTVGVICIALMVIAKAGGMDPALAAGAIVAGAYFGDRCSPMSSSAHLVASITRTDVYVNLKNMAKSSALPLLLALAGYAWLSLLHPLDATEEQFSARIAELFRLHPITALPALLVLAGGLLRIRIKNAMLYSTLTAIVIALSVQDMPAIDMLRALVVGYEAPADNPISYLFTGGGWISIINSILIVFFSSAFAGIFEGAKLLVEVERGVTFLFHTVGGYVTNLIVSTTVSAVACNQTLAILLSAQIQNRLYTGEQARTILALRLENTVILISALIPWNIALSLPLSILDAGPDSIPYMLFLWLMPLIGGLNFPKPQTA